MKRTKKAKLNPEVVRQLTNPQLKAIAGAACSAMCPTVGMSCYCHYSDDCAGTDRCVELPTDKCI